MCGIHMTVHVLGQIYRTVIDTGALVHSAADENPAKIESEVLERRFHIEVSKYIEYLPFS
jgi:hypothetical protein